MSAATFTEAYRQAGYRIANPRNQWSARKPDGSAVALTVWASEIERSAEPWVVDTRGHAQLAEWIGRQGNTIRKRDIAHALAACGGRVDLILCVAVDPAEQPRRIKSARYWPERVGWLDPAAFDPGTGTFRMELRPA